MSSDAAEDWAHRNLNEEMNEGYFPIACMLFLVFKHSLMLWIILLYHRVTFWLLSSDPLNPRYRSRGQKNVRKRYIEEQTKEDTQKIQK